MAMVSDVEVLTVSEDALHRFEPWRPDHIPREGESVWVPDHGRRCVEHVIHAPAEGYVGLVVSDDEISHLTPAELADRGDGDD